MLQRQIKQKSGAEYYCTMRAFRFYGETRNGLKEKEFGLD